MIYGDWEDGYEQLPVLFNAIKAVKPGMHYEYIPKPNAWEADILSCFLVLPLVSRGL